MPITASSFLIRDITCGRADSSFRDFVFFGLEFDSRAVRGGELFIALPGASSHGNSFINMALERGAALVVADANADLPEISEKERIILVDDSQKAFWSIAAWWRDQINLPTLAITGSVGKTTVKEMAAAILLQKGPGTYSQKSYNNHVGVPYTICKASRDHYWMVLEVGMNHSGEIAPLSELARPHVAAVSTVAPAHIGNMGSLEAIAEEKLQIVSGLRKGGYLLLNSQSDMLCSMAARKDPSDKYSVKYFGAAPAVDSLISDVRAHGLEGISFNLKIGEQQGAVSMKVLGKQNAWNACCAALAASLICPDLTISQIIDGLKRFTAPLMRLNLRYLADATIIIDDSYNANPASMKAAIELLADLRGDSQRIGLVIGDMLELGNFSSRYHSEISDLIARIRPDFLIAVGEESHLYLSSSGLEGIFCRHCKNADDAAVLVADLKFDFLLVKASRGIGLEKVVKYLTEMKGELPYEPQLSSQENAT